MPNTIKKSYAFRSARAVSLIVETQVGQEGEALPDDVVAISPFRFTFEAVPQKR